MRRWIAAIAAVLLSAGAAGAEPVRDGPQGRVAVELAPETAGVAPGGTVHVALRQQIDKGWHTYWRNSGDSGEPTRIDWALPPGWRAGEIVWPTPSRQVASESIVNYGYSGEVYLPVPIAVPATARPGETVTLSAAVNWLVCEEICIPEDAVLSVSLPVVAGTPLPHRSFGRAVAATLAAAPKPAGLTAGFTKAGERLRLGVAGPALADADVAGAYFFPFDGGAVTHAARQAVERGPDGLTLTLEPGFAFQAPSPPGTLAGVLALKDGQAFEIAATAGALPGGAGGLGPPTERAGEGGSGALALAVGFAFLGGLILNLMPCVFPVLAMKAAALAGHAGETRAARLRGVAFAAGVIATFLALAGALIALRAAGQAAGWGFQLQSPAVVAALALLMLLVALNLSGVFEVGGSIQSLGAGGAGRQDAAGAFLTGALAVVVAAPCTAPFMAGAIGYAATQPAAVSLLVFLALALGFAAPFTALSFSPGLLARLPRPGPWMDGFRKLLAFPMYGAALWLAWVFAQQVGTTAQAGLLALGLLAAFAAWVFGAGQRHPGGPLLRGAGMALAAGALVAFGVSAWGLGRLDGGAEAETRAVSASAIPAEPFSPARLAALRAEGRPVFVNFTADWCVTCKVNERAALASARVADAFRDGGVTYLKADWTRRDDVIARTLAEHGRSGVPLYLFYAPGVDAPRVLPQLLTEGAVTAALRAKAPVQGGDAT